MRKLIAPSVIALLAVLVFSSTASAVPIQIGVFSWEVREVDAAGAPSTGAFTVLSTTGLGIPGFPDQLLTFTGLSVLVEDGGIAGCDVPTADAPDCSITQAEMIATAGGSYDSPLFTLPAQWPLSLILTGAILQGGFTVGGIPYTVIDPALFTLGSDGSLGPDGQLGDGQSIIGDFDYEYIYVEARQVQQVVPEPATMFLLGSGVVGLVARRRRAARKAS